MEDLWDVKRVARYLGVTERTVYSKVSSGDLPAIKVGSRWRFRLGDIETWLDERRGGADAPSTCSMPSAATLPDRARLESLLAEIEDPLERRLAFSGLLSRACRILGRREPVVVGGHAVEFYTAGGYTTVDIGLVGASDAISEVLSGWGFEKEGRHWYDGRLGLLVEVPGDQLEDAQIAHMTKVEVRGEHVAVLGVEDLIVDRLNACVHWEFEEACEWASVLIEAHRDRIDWEYLKRRAGDEDVLDRLEASSP